MSVVRRSFFSQIPLRFFSLEVSQLLPLKLVDFFFPDLYFFFSFFRIYYVVDVSFPFFFRFFSGPLCLWWVPSYRFRDTGTPFFPRMVFPCDSI